MKKITDSDQWIFFTSSRLVGQKLYTSIVLSHVSCNVGSRMNFDHCIHCAYFGVYEETFVHVGWSTVMMIWSQMSHWNRKSGFQVILISIFSFKLGMNELKIFYLTIFFARVVIRGVELYAKCFLAGPASFYKNLCFINDL